MTGPDLTPQEVQDLRLVRARARMDRGDLQPMLRIHHHNLTAEVIPWPEAAAMEVFTND